MLEQVDRRILAALELLDATTGARVLEPVRITAPELRLVRNQQGLYVVTDTPRLNAHTFSFISPPSTPRLGSVELELHIDTAGSRYLARRLSVRLPRDPNPTRSDADDSLFRPVPVKLFPSPSAPISPLWAVIRASVQQPAQRRPVAGALIRIVRSSDPTVVLGMGLSDARGEALVTVAGLPISTWGEGTGPVQSSEVEVSVETIFDPRAKDPPDPDMLEMRRERYPTSRVVTRLAAGRVLTMVLQTART